MKQVARRQYRPAPYGLRGFASRALSTASGAALRAGASYVKTKLGRRFSEGSPLTNQYDARIRYVRKPMPKAKRRRWKRFTGKVKHVMLQMQPLQSYCDDNGGAVMTAAADAQTTSGIMLGGTQVTNNSELYEIFSDQFTLASVAAAKPYSLFIKSMSLDVQLTNTGSGRAVLDVYTLICRKSYEVASPIATQYTANYNEQTNISLASVTHPATTPWQNPLFLKYWRIIKKQEIILGSGNYTTLQMRIPYNKHLQGRLLTSCPQAIPGISRAFLFQVRGSPENNAGTARLQAVEVTWKSQITINYGRPPGQVTAGTGTN